MRDGRTFEERVDVPKGEPDNPLTRDELATKFRRLTVPNIGADATEAVVQTVLRAGGNSQLATIFTQLHDGGANQ